MDPEQEVTAWVFGCTDAGMVRKNNEDNFAVSAFQISEKDPTPAVFAILCDGIGGHKAGEVASEMAVNRISAGVARSDGSRPTEILRAAFRETNEKIVAAARDNPGRKGMGATLSCAWVIGRRLYTASAEPGIQCEACPRPGSLHVSNPPGVDMPIVRDSELCGECHRRGEVENVDAKGGFIEHHEQYAELFQGKHITLECVDCHNPHEGVKQLEEAGLPTTRTRCENCHAAQARYQTNEKHVDLKIACVTCHMPRIVKTAWGDETKFTGDIRSHLMSINPGQIDQFYTVSGEDGVEHTYSYSEIGLNFACRQCHVPDTGLERDDQTLIDAAYNYHARPAEPPAAPTAAP